MNPIISIHKNFTYREITPTNDSYQRYKKRFREDGRLMIPKINLYQQMEWIIKNGPSVNFINILVSNTWWNMAMYEIYNQNDKINLTINLNPMTGNLTGNVTDMSNISTLSLGIDIKSMDTRLEQITYLLVMNKINEKLSNRTELKLYLNDNINWSKHIAYYENSKSNVKFTPSFNIGDVWINLEKGIASTTPQTKSYNVKLNKGWNMVCNFDQNCNSFEESTVYKLLEYLANDTTETILFYESNTPIETILLTYDKLHGGNMVLNSKRKRNIIIGKKFTAIDMCHAKRLFEDKSLFGKTKYRIIKTPEITNVDFLFGEITTTDIKRWIIMCNCNSVDSELILNNMKWQQIDESLIRLCENDSLKFIERILYDKISLLDVNATILKDALHIKHTFMK